MLALKYSMRLYKYTNKTIYCMYLNCKYINNKFLYILMY